MLSKNDSRGFSLLEILVALGIFAMACGGILVGVDTALSVQARDEMMMTATFLTQNKMSEIENEIEADREKNKFPGDLEKAGEFSEPYEAYSWKYTIKKVEIPISGEAAEQAGPMKAVMQQITKDISDNVREVKLIVSWADPISDKTKELKVVTHVVNFK